MNRDEQIGIDAPCLRHTLAERDEEIAVARQQCAHVGLAVDLGLEAAGDGERHVFFEAAATSYGAGIFTAMTGVDDDCDEAINLTLRRRLALCVGFRLSLGAFLKQRHERVGCFVGIEIQHQPVAVVSDRREREHLRLHFLFQFNDDAHDIGLETSGADQLDLRIVVENFLRQTLQHRVELDTFEIEDEAFGIFQQQVGEFERCAVFQRDAGVISCRPDAHAEQRGQCLAEGRRDKQRQAGAGGTEEVASGKPGSAANHACPRALTARSDAWRPLPATRSSMHRSAAST